MIFCIHFRTGITEEEIQIIKINCSSWSLNDTCTYIKQDDLDVLLQFECEGSPWIIPNSENQLTIASNLSEEQGTYVTAMQVLSVPSALLYFAK